MQTKHNSVGRVLAAGHITYLEFIWLSTHQPLLTRHSQSLVVSGVDTASVSKVRDKELAITVHFNHVISGCFHQLWPEVKKYPAFLSFNKLSMTLFL